MATRDESVILTCRDNSLMMMKEAAALGILPPQREALKWWGFYGLKAEDMFELWRIYMLLLHRHRYQAEVLAEWCSKSQLARRAIDQFGGRHTREGRWLFQHQSNLQPSEEEWPTPDVYEKWFDCARLCLDSDDIKRVGNIDNTLLTKRKGYLAYGAFLLGGPLLPPFPEYIDNIWQELDINTQVSDRWWEFLYEGIISNSTWVQGDGEITFLSPFTIFWDRYTQNNLVSWAKTYAN